MPLESHRASVRNGIFINSGQRTNAPANAPAGGRGRGGGSNRSFEYYTLSNQYARFLIKEVLPEVSREYKLTDGPEGRAVK